MSSRISYGTDKFQFCDLRLPHNGAPHPVAVMVHGGFWRSLYGLEYLDHMCAALTAAGMATWNIEYRRIGNPGGGWPGTFDDVANAAGHLGTLADKFGLD